MASIILLSSLLSYFIAPIVSLPGDIAKFRKSHDFPLYTPSGISTANEFQMVIPENMVYNTMLADSGYKINSVSPLLINNDDVVTISYSSLTPKSSDWIGAYSPANVQIHDTAPVKYGYCDDSNGYLTTGVGSLTFNLTNLRSDVAFYYFSGGTSKGVVQNVSSQIVTFENNNQPLRRRIVPTGAVGEFKLLWSSATSTTPTMKWGTVSGKYTNTIAATTTTYTRADMCGAPANTTGWRDPGLIHSALMQGLDKYAAQRLYYIFGDDVTNDYSPEYTFQTPPLAGKQPPNRPTSVLIFDDLGRGSTDMSYTWNEYGRPSVYTSYSAGARIANGEIDAVFHGGDLSYATGYSAVWDFYADMFSPVTGGTTYLSIVGNHEIDWYTGDTLYTLPATTGNQKPDTDSGGECGIPTLTLYPEPAPATIDQPWWSYDIGLIHFVGISSEHNFSTGSPQYLWLENDLKSVDRTITPWVLFGSHRAMYLNSDYGGPVTSDLNVSALLIEYIEPLLWKYRVNIGFYGHNHVVQRTSAVLNKKVIQRSEVVTNDKGQLVNTFRNPQATVHFVVGTGGAGFTKNAVSPWPEWNEQVFYLWGYAIATAESASTLTWTWYNNTDDAVMYRVVMTQCDPTQPWDLNSTITCDETGNDSSDNNGNVAVIVTLCVLIPLALLLIILVGVHKYYKDKNLRRSEEVEAFIEGNKKEFSSTEYRSMQ